MEHYIAPLVNTPCYPGLPPGLPPQLPPGLPLGLPSGLPPGQLAPKATSPALSVTFLTY